jgi:hypothetical protein
MMRRSLSLHAFGARWSRVQMGNLERPPGSLRPRGSLEMTCKNVKKSWAFDDNNPLNMS